MTGIIVLCRYNSSRLPGKILKKLNGKEILTYILERLSCIPDKYPVVVCTSIEKTDNPIVSYCIKNNIAYYRGSLSNVADRFLGCATENKFENAVRINGDNIFLDAQLIEEMIKTFENKKLNFISNVKKRTFPRGMSIEIVKIDFYRHHFSKFNDDDLEHVMTYFYRMNGQNIEFVFGDLTEKRDINLAIDTEDDLKKAGKIIDAMTKDHIFYNYKDIIMLFDKLEYEN
jgi:spore coat polysaccharide biosynthesis protein SpsF